MNVPNLPGGAVDLSQLGKHLPSANVNPLTGASMSNDTEFDIGELTPTEENLIQSTLFAANKKFMGMVYDPENPEKVWDQFANEVRNRLAELGFTVEIGWEEYQADGLPGTASVPIVTITGRTAKKDTDHERISRELAAGLDGGEKGYIREDGTRHEDPIRKTIS